MKKELLVLLFCCAVLVGCERDDFCVKNPVTSKLIIDFYDDTNRETLKKVERFSIVAAEKTDSLFTNQSFNSISIPLNSLSRETNYTFKKNTRSGASVDNEYATFSVVYETEEEFVSRSCGFKVVFKNVAFSTDTNSWITALTPTTIINLDDQSTAHVQIFH